MKRQSVTCAFGISKYLFHNGLVLQIVAITKEAGDPVNDTSRLSSGRCAIWMTLDRPGDIDVALDFYGEGHINHLVIDVVSFSSMWRNATI